MDHAGAKTIGAPVMTTRTPHETTALALAGTVREEVPAGLRAWLGLASGVLLGGLDLLIARASGLELHLGGRDVSLVTFGIFALSYGAFGFVLGRLLEARRVLERHAATIAAQLGEIQVSQARALHYEKLASIGRLAAGVAHEVRNSLGVVRSSAAFLLEDLETAEGADVDPDRRRAGRFIREEIDPPRRLRAQPARLLAASDSFARRSRAFRAAHAGRGSGGGRGAARRGRCGSRGSALPG